MKDTSDRDIAIINKSDCYGVAVITAAFCIVAHLLWSDLAFYCGVFVGVIVVPIAELVVHISDE